MPIGPDAAANSARDTVALAAEAEAAVLVAMAKAAAASDDAATGVDPHAQNVLRREVAGIAQRFGQAGTAALAAAVGQLYDQGAADAVRSLRQAGLVRELGTADRGALHLILQRPAEAIQATGLRITRWADDTFRTASIRAASLVTAGTTTRRDASLSMLQDLAGQGITGFTDRVGRNWDLPSYAEMVVRSTAGQAAVAGHVAQLSAADIGLVIVSVSDESCKTCAPWEGQILATDGSGAGTISVPSETSDEMVDVDVAGSLDDATADGLFHSNCTHTVDAYLAGATGSEGDSGAVDNGVPDYGDLATAAPPIPTDESPGYQLKQQQRGLERDVRAAKRAEILAGPLGTPDQVRAARQATRARQARLAQFIRDNDRKALSYRTSLRAR